MTPYEQVKIEEELKAFASRNFEKPSVCRNPDQVRFYAAELCIKISEYESRFSFAPAWAYRLLEQYNAQQNSLEQLHTAKISR
jgi:hypothetical protein